ncbi:hypothetical protein AbraCBS73388_005470 [Aspergillus brasiliensis]|uniref:Ecp2 effector protein domain-containing protein n=1 Tax=Aspergillus brasiliensis TaxID=319629 RepID=A0A9W6DS95_9EURO|nr:hypothetical protein AbraCBS73388_005470 [Aspergillus brasiliensis]
MFRSLILSALFATTLGYRLFEYSGERCTGSQVGLLRLAGPSACNKLNEGVATSLLVKIDNVHDDQYSVNVYDTDDCTGSIVGTVHNMNGCLNLYAFSNVVGKSVQVVPAPQKRDATESEGFETDYLYNLPPPDDEHLKKSNHTDDGAYVNEAFGMFLSAEPEHVSNIQSLWAIPIEEQTAIEPVNSTPTTFLDTRQFEWAYCNFEALCLGAISLSYKVRNSDVMRAVRNSLQDHKWAAIAQGVDFVVARAANGITVFGAISGSGSGDPSTCESKKDVGDLINDMITSSGSSGGDGITNALWQVKDKYGRTWDVAFKLHDDHKKNTDNCGDCSRCL